MTTDFHVTSLILRVLPEKMEEVCYSIGQMESAETSAHDESKLVVLLEGTSDQALLAGISEINGLPGVLSTTMAYHQCEELEEGEL